MLLTTFRFVFEFVMLGFLTSKQRVILLAAMRKRMNPSNAGCDTTLAHTSLCAVHNGGQQLSRDGFLDNRKTLVIHV